MKCPKCGYLGFERVDRCRNCGYEFSLSAVSNTPELPIRDERPFKPLDDLALLDAALAKAPSTPDLPDELPLFESELPGDQPLITRPSPPRTPLAVRRATPDVPRLRSTSPRAPLFDLGDVQTAVPARAPSFGRPVRPVSPAPPVEEVEEPAGIAARLAAVAIDLGLLAIIDSAVIYLTMKICGLTMEDIRILPRGPLIAFLALQNGGYLVGFTAGGQTLGKMVAGIRVVSARAGGSLDFGHSLLRTLVWVVLAVPAGLGLLTALLTPDRRGLHDRCAGTKVVRASA